MQLLNNIRNTSSSIIKANFLVSANELEKKLLEYTYNPYKTYRCRFGGIDNSNIGEPSEEMFELLDSILIRALTGNNTIKAVNDFADKHGDLIKLVCNKDLASGISATTINSVFFNLIPEFNIQLAVEVPANKIKFPIAGQLKYNGARVITVIKDENVFFYSRGGHEFFYPELKAEILKGIDFSFGNWVLDGELTFGDSQNEDHTKVSGIVNSSMKGTPIPNGLKLQYNVFDCMTVDNFYRNVCNEHYKGRWSSLENIVEYINSNMIVLALTYDFTSINHMNEVYSKLLEDGYEGLILKDWMHKYTFKKNNNWIKMKATNTADLYCTGYEEGLGRLEGHIGALNCEGIVEGKMVKVKVGSGLNDYDRSIDPNNYIGQTIEVKYNKVIQDMKTGEFSLFLPRFVCIRIDKS